MYKLCKLSAIILAFQIGVLIGMILMDPNHITVTNILAVIILALPCALYTYVYCTERTNDNAVQEEKENQDK